MEEAEAVVRLIREKGLKQITLAGHSQGGDKAIDVAAILQKGTEVGVNGVILFDPVGIYEQTASQLARSFAKDTFINTPATLAKNVTQNVSAVHRGVVLATDIIFNIVKEMRDSGSEYWRRFKSELDEMSRRNPNIAEVRAPVVLMTGAADPVSDREHIVSAGDEAARREALGEEEGISDKTLAARESFLKEHVFVKSPYIRMLVPEKMGDHGMPLFRAQSAARASLYLLGRYHRNS